jgi:ABC-type cobalamin/Fe3+-siderophores transport system ATPase subunit
LKTFKEDEKLLSLQNISLSRGNRRILDALNAEALTGEIVMLLGGNGSDQFK